MVNREAFIRVIGRIWHVKEGVEIESLTGNIFSFHFNDMEDHRKVLSGAHWSFDNALLVLEEPVGKREMIGEVVDVDGGLAGDCVRKFLRVRVHIDINKPLRRCLRVDVMGDEVETINERLPNICFQCGRISHMTNECQSDDLIPMVDGVEKPLFGFWMKASSSFRKNNFQNLRGRTVFNDHTSASISKVESERKMAMPISALIEVHEEEHNGKLDSFNASINVINAIKKFEVEFLAFTGKGKQDELSECNLLPKTHGNKRLNVRLGPYGEGSFVFKGDKVVQAQEENLMEQMIKGNPCGISKPSGHNNQSIIGSVNRDTNCNSGKRVWSRKIRASNVGNFRENLVPVKCKRSSFVIIDREEPIQKKSRGVLVPEGSGVVNQRLEKEVSCINSEEKEEEDGTSRISEVMVYDGELCEKESIADAECHSVLNVDDLGLFCTIVWRIWYLCNLVVQEAPNQNVFDVLH
ncbi:hypothetical protein EZV62_018047 [Acer yangbiense]|uniref:CCHC-type domain-containing protein n=1 Tax=Acer yangbiense TaxID=1000413 RepID=A0A5C7HIP3_9ROSI|nr:hypothetical protein EZV62_018047 [Acer yangbiense]